MNGAFIVIRLQALEKMNKHHHHVCVMSKYWASSDGYLEQLPDKRVGREFQSFE
jgi:hypothetical protein